MPGPPEQRDRYASDSRSISERVARPIGRCDARPTEEPGSQYELLRMLASVMDGGGWTQDLWVALLEQSIREAASPTMIEVRRLSRQTVLIYADPGESGGASLELVVSKEECQVFVADVLNAELKRPDDEDEVIAIVRGVTQYGCRVLRSGMRRYLEIGPHREEHARPLRVERDWVAWSAARRSADPEPHLIYRI